jgi:hypothetical protein
MFSSGNDSHESEAIGSGSPARVETSERLHFLRSHDLSTELSPELTQQIDLEAEQRRIDHRRAELLLEVTETGVCDTLHGHTTSAWLADRTQLSPKACGTRIMVTRRMTARHRLMMDALADGRVGWQHIKVLDQVSNKRIWSGLNDLLPTIIELAQVAGFERWAREVRGIGHQMDQDGGYDPATDSANNELRLVATTDGFTYVSGKLVGELALTIRKLIEAETDRVLTRYRSDAEASDGENPVPRRTQAAAEALAELLERASGVPDGEGKLPEPEIVVILKEETNTLTDDEGNHLSLEVLRFILAAGLIRPLEVSKSGDPLRMGRAIRYANRHMRRALLIRDGGCIFPGCDRPASWCDAHHVDEWDHGGPTDIDNLALQCRHHHRVTHRPSWVMTRDPDQTDFVGFRWRTPSGRFIYSQRHQKRNPTDRCASP